jgi:hypothetical protein
MDMSPEDGCWLCHYFDQEFGKQISCPFEIFGEKFKKVIENEEKILETRM